STATKACVSDDCNDGKDCDNNNNNKEFDNCKTLSFPTCFHGAIVAHRKLAASDDNRGKKLYTRNMQKILLYYKFTPLSDPEAVKLWQKTLCDSLNLRGRILVSKHGLNGTVGGEMSDLKAYTKATKQYPAFKDIVFK